MTIEETPDTVGCTIVGGGIHGTYLAQRLLEDTALTRDTVRIVDPNDRLLASFREKSAVCGMSSLRSTFVHHIGTEPFSLESFAEAADREDELISTVDYPPRPSLALFLDHAESVIERKSLSELHDQATVTGIQTAPTGAQLRVETTAGTHETARCVIAIGHGGRVHRPKWAAESGRIKHVWGEFASESTADSTVVVGGGITAVQLACELAETESVVLLSRRALEWEVSEADPPWIGWGHIERNLHTHPPGSRERFELVSAARHTATVPPYLYPAVESQISGGSLTLKQGIVDSVTLHPDEVELHLDCQKRLRTDRVVLATGFETVFDHPFIDRLTDALSLRQGYRGVPVLDDTTLQWQRTDGGSAPIHVSGALAVGSVGPYAPNLPGARRAGDRIVDAINATTTPTEKRIEASGRS